MSIKIEYFSRIADILRTLRMYGVPEKVMVELESAFSQEVNIGGVRAQEICYRLLPLLEDFFWDTDRSIFDATGSETLAEMFALRRELWGLILLGDPVVESNGKVYAGGSTKWEYPIVPAKNVFGSELARRRFAPTVTVGV